MLVSFSQYNEAKVRNPVWPCITTLGAPVLNSLPFALSLALWLDWVPQLPICCSMSFPLLPSVLLHCTSVSISSSFTFATFTALPRLTVLLSWSVRFPTSSPKSMGASLTFWTLKDRARHSRVVKSQKPCSFSTSHVRCTCSIHGEKVPIRPPATWKGWDKYNTIILY